MFEPVADLEVTVPGRPRGQGSLTLWKGADGRERAHHAPATVQHRNLMIGLLRDAWGAEAAIRGPVAVRILAHYPRPVGHYGTGRNRASLKVDVPARPITAPDLDKVCRLVLDALTIAGVIADDAQVTMIRAEKTYGPSPGTHVEVFDLGGGVQ